MRTLGLIGCVLGVLSPLGVEVVAGRPFTSADRAGAPPVMTINQTLARQHFGDAPSVGRRLAIRSGSSGGERPRQVVGVLRDVRPLGFESEPRPEVYLPLEQVPTRSLTYVVHADVDPASLALPVQEAIWSVNPYEAVWAVRTMESLLGDLLRERRFNLVLSSAFAALALILTAIGLYGLVSYFVEERMGELGIRRALGGRTGDIAGMVLREAASLADMGIALGLVGAVVVTRGMRGLLYGIEPTA